MLVNGREIAEDVLSTLEKERASVGRTLALGILMSQGDAATESFIRIKSKAAHRLGVEVIRRELAETSTTEDAIAALQELAAITQGLIVQLPLPPSIDAEAVIATIPNNKDVDALGPKPHEVLAPVAAATLEILERAGVSTKGKKAVIIGAGRLVGKPVAEMLTEMGANIVFVTEHAGSLDELFDADIAILGAGKPGFIKPAMLKPGVVLIDAGTSEAAGGKLVGDADASCANMASVFTPVPGGVGPIAIAMIFKNLFALAKKHETH